MQLQATAEEKRDIGGALSDALGTFEDSAPFVKLLNVLGPWSGVIDGLAGAVYNRIIFIAQHRIGKAPSTSSRPSPEPAGPAYAQTANGRAYVVDEEDGIYAPDPAAGFG